MVKDNTYGIADLQEKMLDILKYLISVCEKNELRYWVAGGTLLGTIRHKGFIPWDDDLDVLMPRPDYEKLWALLRKGDSANKKYKLCRTSRRKNYHHRVMQMVDLTTTFINKRSVDEDIEHGVYIDILPLDARAEGRIAQALQAKNAILFSIYNIQCMAEANGGKMKNIINAGTKMMLAAVKSPDKRYRLWKKYEKKMLVGDYDQASEKVVITSALREMHLIYSAKCFSEAVKMPFEDIEVNVPIGYEEYLTSFYGDYMKLPPEEDRTVKHNTVYMDLDNPYTKYKGIYYCVKKKDGNNE